jgi:hypothetical protein
MDGNILLAVPSTSLAKLNSFYKFEALRRTENIKKKGEECFFSLYRLVCAGLFWKQ